MKNIDRLTYFKIFSIITFGSGVYLHTARVLFGADYFLEHILTLKNDKIFSIPMMLAALFAWFAFKNTDLTKRWKKIIYTMIAVYITISIPVHIKSWFTNDLKQLKAFPEEYSYFILPVLFLMLLFTLSLKRKQPESQN